MEIEGSSWSEIWMRCRMKKCESSSYYHVCTDGNQLSWMFRDDDDFRNGVNRLAICSFVLKLSVVCFVLMDNHVHFILYGTLAQCKEFSFRYKAAISRWIQEKYGVAGYLSNLSTEIIPIESEESLLETIAYIDRNSIMAGYKCLPCDYPWGSAKYMFRETGSAAPKSPLDTHEALNKRLAGVAGLASNGEVLVKAVEDLQTVERRSLIKTRKQIPSNWVVDQYGMILPHCFLAIDTLNKLFGSPLRYLYFLSKKLEGKIDLQHGIKSFISDKEMRVITGRLSKEIFATDDVRSLDFKSKIVIARKLRYQYASTPKQVSRMLSLDVANLSEFI